MRALKHLARDEAGATAIEFAFIFMVLFMLTVAALEYGRVLFLWGAAEKGTHLGARYAAVADPVSPLLKTIGTVASGSSYGTACTDSGGAVNADCWFTPVTCSNAGCSNGSFDAAAFNAILAQVQRVAPFIQPENLSIEYSFSGLGFVGRPGGQPVIVTLRLVDQTVALMVLDTLLGLPELTMPPFTASLIGEDLKTSGV